MLIETVEPKVLKKKSVYGGYDYGISNLQNTRNLYNRVKQIKDRQTTKPFFQYNQMCILSILCTILNVYRKWKKKVERCFDKIIDFVL